MTKKIKNINICNAIWCLVLLMPFIVYIGWVIFNTKNGSGVFELNEFLNSFNSLFGNMGFLQTLINNLFAVFEVSTSNIIINCASSYIAYFIVVYLIHIGVDLLLFIPKMVKGVFEND